MAHRLNWFEIPVVDLARATRFYESVLSTTLKVEDFHGTRIAVFTRKQEGDVTGALIHSPHMRPSLEGSRVFLDAGSDLDGAIRRVAQAGGKVLVEKTSIGALGSFAVFQDTEGNAVALHAHAGH
ncbi:VOC family protein [Myxococcus sp. CA051A]|uniref:VOC family protein n=1 Tax=unclassified Myxococcus TaxID=2648731 RepID=UPI00157BA951|nr:MULTISPECIES: VOC family protein [unclassified Myxococcus]NTX35102.1 VOC family protein [Myxococcus sp. CA033]NTX50534.1 VOC family protein [Myxococcus sp. CA039A]NTX65069.1 VOC family protein [Myxococcus sp. CA051A]